MKIFSGIFGGGLFLIVTLVLIFKLGLDWKIALILCTASIFISILIIRYPDINILKAGPFSTKLVTPNTPKIESEKPIGNDDTWKFSPIIIANVKTISQDFKDFIVEIREKGNKSTIVRRTAPGIKTGFKWEMVPLVFEHTKTGTVYEIRICVQALDGNKSGFTNWITKTAGE